MFNAKKGSMTIKNKLLIIAGIGLLAGASSCKKFLDVNKNPNIANTVEPNLLLPSTEIYIGSALGVDFETNGSIWAQYWTQNPNSSQFRQLEQYQPTSDDYNSSWQLLYANAGEDLYQLEKLAIDKKQKQYQAIALVLKAYVFQLVTDAWGDAPFAEALKGSRDDGHIVSPHYDAQQVIYTGIISLIDQGTALMDPSDPVHPGADDLIYGGDMEKWQKFANTLKLRVLLRMSEKDPATAQAGITALGSGPFLADGEDAQINYSAASGQKNPLYSEQVGLQQTQNVVASRTCIDSMNSNNDYRLLVFYESISSGAYVGITQGNFDAVVAPGSYSIPSYYVAGDAQNDLSALAPVKLLTGYESLFLQAEAAVRYTGGDAESLFMQGIAASFNSYASAFNDNGVPAADAYDIYVNGDTSAGAPPAYWSQFPATGTVQQKIRHIITQKWFSMCGNQGFEAWCEWRRTGYPDFFVHSANSLIGNVFPRRFIYPNTEVTRNANFPGLKSVTDKVWWDIH